MTKVPNGPIVHAAGTDWLGLITAALWLGVPLSVVLQVVELLPAINGYSLVPFVTILAVVFLIILNIRNHRRGQHSRIAAIGLGLVVVALMVWGALYWLLSGLGDPPDLGAHLAPAA